MRWSLSSKVAASLVGILLALSALVTALTFVEVRRVEIEEQRALVDVMNYTFETLLGQDAIPSLQRVVENDATNSEIERIVIVDRDGVVLASSDRIERGKAVESPNLREFLGAARFQQATRSTRDALIILQPLRGSRSLGGADGDIVGVAEVTLSLGVIEAQARAAALRLLSISLGSFLALSVGLAVVLRTLVTRPVHELAAVAHRFRVVVLPLIGTIDVDRAAQIQVSLPLGGSLGAGSGAAGGNG